MPAEDAPRSLGAVTGGLEHSVAQPQPDPSGRLIQDQRLSEGSVAAERMDVAPKGKPGALLSRLDIEAFGDGGEECGMGMIAADHYFIQLKSKL
jgi:hypothetical protein